MGAYRRTIFGPKIFWPPYLIWVIFDDYPEVGVFCQKPGFWHEIPFFLPYDHGTPIFVKGVFLALGVALVLGPFLTLRI